MSNILEKISRKIKLPMQAIRNAKSQKVFCIGKNKTGTTSMERLFSDLGLVVGSQRKAEKLTVDWLSNDFKRIIKYVKYEGQAFQDIPFSLPRTYKVLDEAFPGSKFILTKRYSAEVWCDSLVNFHAKIFGKGSIPNKIDLQNANYVEPGFAWEVMNTLHDIKGEDIYNREMLIRDYNLYNEEVERYFEGSNEKLLILSLDEKDIVSRIQKFLNIERTMVDMPWENRNTVKRS